ncbi:MAG: type II secretion system F family protein [Armatimonadetes bacterium]|nr:type II secretion system F family protein [Armatimonadota bacterium]
MAQYSYKVKDRAGNTRTGALEAENEHQAAAMIREAGGLPMEIKLVRGVSSQSSDGLAGNAIVRHLVHPFWTGVSIGNLVYFYRQMATLLAGGMAMSESLRSIGSRSRGSLGRIVNAAQERVQNGGKLSQEMARHPRVFLPLQISLLQAGEQGGLLEQMTERIASYLEYEITIRQRIAKAMFYPVLVLVFVFMLPVIIPWVVKGSDAAWAVFYYQSRTIIFPMVMALIMIKFLMQFEPVRFAWDLFKIQPPLLGTVARKIAMSRFSRALALLFSAGLPITQAVSIAADACANIAMGKKLKQAIPALKDGQPLMESLKKTGAVLPMVLDMIAVGEQTGSYDATLQKVADYMDAEADSTISKLSVALFVLMILGVGIAAAIFAMSWIGDYASKLGGAGG